MRIRRRRQPEQAPSGPENDVTTLGLHKAVRRLAALVRSRTVPPESALDGLAEISDDDIASATGAWDAAQRDASTGLDGMLDARVE